MSDQSVDLSSTPADSTRWKVKQGKKMADKKGTEVFKVPNIPLTSKNKGRIRSVAERKSDLLSKWESNCKDATHNPSDNNEGVRPLFPIPTSNDSLSTAAKLAKFKFASSYLNTEGRDEDALSLGERAKVTQAKIRRFQTEMGESMSDCNPSEENDHEHNNGQGNEPAASGKHDQAFNQHDDASTAETRYTDVSAAQSSIAEQAEIEERRQLENMKEKIQGESAIEEVLHFILEKLQIGIKEIKVEQHNINNRIGNLEKADLKTKKIANYCVNKLQEISTTNFKLVQATIKQDQDIHAIQTQLHKCENKIQKGTMTINGIKKEENEDLKSIINDFLRDKMKIDQTVAIKTTYRLNKYKIAFQLLDPNNVGVIFGHTKNLKGIKNSDKGRTKSRSS